MTLDSVDIVCNNKNALTDYIVIILKKMISISKSPESHEQLYKKNKLPKLKQFINSFFEQCNNYVSTPVIIFSLIYLKRIKDCIPPNSCGEYDTPYRLFIASILISSKYLCEAGTNLTSKKVSKCTSFIFNYQEINQMERSFLGLIKYDLWVTKKSLEVFLKRHEYQLQSQLIDISLNEDAFISNYKNHQHNHHDNQNDHHQHNNNKNNVNANVNDNHHHRDQHYDSYHNIHNHNHNHHYTTQKNILNKMMVQKKEFSFELTPPFLLLSPACSPVRTFSFIKKIDKNKGAIY